MKLFPDDLLQKDAQSDPPTWWKPDWKSALASVGYRWLALLIILSLLALLCIFILGAIILFAGQADPTSWLWIKLAVFFGGAAVSVAGFIFKKSVAARSEHFCIYCGYNLSGLPDNYRCPECGRPYTFEMIDDYRRDPAWFIERWKSRHALPPRDETLHIPTDAPRRRSRDGT